jgi:hypothetical protein
MWSYRFNPLEAFLGQLHIHKLKPSQVFPVHLRRFWASLRHHKLPWCIPNTAGKCGRHLLPDNGIPKGPPNVRPIFCHVVLRLLHHDEQRQPHTHLSRPCIETSKTDHQKHCNTHCNNSECCRCLVVTSTRQTNALPEQTSASIGLPFGKSERFNTVVSFGWSTRVQVAGATDSVAH